MKRPRMAAFAIVALVAVECVAAEPQAGEQPSPEVTRFMALVKARSLKCSFPDGVFTVYEENAFATKAGALPPASQQWIYTSIQSPGRPERLD